jgi:N-formylglutamate deformylase
MTPQTSDISLLLPAARTAPVILTSPHSGRRYDPAFLAASRLDAVTIRRSEDSFVEELFGTAPAHGAPLLAADFPRAWCDVNREAWELDPTMFADRLPDYVNTASPRVSAGLGTIARIVGTGEEIYSGKLSFADAQARVASCWQPFHTALQHLIDETVSQFGACLVIDCHSMPSMGSRLTMLPDVVLGDGHGTSCAPKVTSFMHNELNKLGFTTRRNDPYAGGYITRHYGQPRNRVHVVQLELARGLYMNEAKYHKRVDFNLLKSRLETFIQATMSISCELLGSSPLLPLAAE